MRNMLPLAAVLLVPVLTSCSPPAAQEDVQAEREGATVHLENCGVAYDVATPVNRAVTTEQGATDTLLLLGAANQIAGTGHQKDAPPTGYEEVAADLQALSPSVPTAEQIRAVDADFIYSPFDSVWTPDSVGTRQEWQALGVATYQSNTQCPNNAGNQGKSQFELLERDFAELGSIFGRQEEARKLIEQQRASLNTARESKAPKGTTFVLLYSTIGGQPYVAGGTSIVSEMGDAVGMTNAFEDVGEEWPQVSWEAIAEANPDVIILADLPVRGKPGDRWEDKVESLQNTPGTSELEAVRNHRYIVVNAVDTSAGGRAYQAVDAIADAVRQGVAE